MHFVQDDSLKAKTIYLDCRAALAMTIIQQQALLDAGHPSTLIIPLTTNLFDNAEPLRLRIIAQGNLEKDSDLMVDQIRAIDNKRLIKGPLLHCEKNFMFTVYSAIDEIMGF